jgi:DNA-binding beta-propeller fold protein YncE
MANLSLNARIARLWFAALMLTGCGTLQTANVTPSIQPQEEQTLDGSALPASALYESDHDHNAIEIFRNSTWNKIGTITSGLKGPNGTWLDLHGLYVVNTQGVKITQYTTTTSPAFTYTKGIKDPVAVTTDRAGNVYEADWDNGGNAGFVNEYAQASNVVKTRCMVKGGVQDVAVDPKGNVFVDYTTPFGGKLVEYTAFAGCTHRALGAYFNFPAGMVLDKRGNLLVCDLYGPTVDLVAPPYNRVTPRFGSGFTGPDHVTINAQNTRAYVADFAAGTVDVFEYPTGKRLATLKKDITVPLGAVDSSNYVP